MRANALIVTFLAVCAIGGMIALTRARVSDKTVPKSILGVMVAIYVAVICIMALVSILVVWDCFHPGHVPLSWSTPIIDVCLAVIAVGTFTIYNLVYRARTDVAEEIKAKSMAANH